MHNHVANGTAGTSKNATVMLLESNLGKVLSYYNKNVDIENKIRKDDGIGGKLTTSQFEKISTAAAYEDTKQT